MRKVLKRCGLLLAGTLWVAAVGTGFTLVERHEYRAEPSRSPVQHWPESSSLERSRDGLTLLMFVHPQCPCTRAALNELQHVMMRLTSPATVSVVCSHFTDSDTMRETSPNWRLATRIPGVHLVDDAGCIEADRFRVDVSGEVLAFDVDGQLRFKGSITPSRGHEGESFGRSALVSLSVEPDVSSDTMPVTCPVYGCRLRPSSPLPHNEKKP